eukprot:UN05913
MWCLYSQYSAKKCLVIHRVLPLRRKKLLQDTLRSNGSAIFKFFIQILKSSKTVPLLHETLKALINYVPFLPPEYIFETDLIEMLTIKFLPTEFQLRCLECMCEIVSLPIVENSNLFKANSNKKISLYYQKLHTMFCEVVKLYKNMIPSDKNISEVLRKAGSRGEEFIRLFTTFACNYLRNNIQFVESQSRKADPHVVICLDLLLQTINVKEDEILVVLTEFWTWWSTQQAEQARSNSRGFSSSVFFGSATNSKSQYFAHVCPDFAKYTVLNMVRPKEVIVVRDALQNTIESEIKQSIRLQIYKNMSTTLQKICEFDLKTALTSISNILTGNLFGNITRSQNFSNWPILNSVCWSIGSIANHVPEQDSKDFLVKSIQALLYLCEKTPEKQDKAIVAANIMYVVRKNPRFLQRYWKLLQTVIGKLFEFMLERFPGVQDMACETFEEIACKCSRAFSSDKQADAVDFLDQLIKDLPRTISYLSPKLIHQMWKGFGWILKAERNEAIANELLVKVMTVPNMVWVRSVTKFKNDAQAALNDRSLCTNLINILKTNRSLAETLKQKYILQLGKIIQELLLIYNMTAHALKQYGDKNGNNSMKHDTCLVWRNIIHSSLELLTTCVETKCLTDTRLVQNVLDIVLRCFKAVPPLARDPQVFVLSSAIVVKIKESLEPILPTMLRVIVAPTREMIDNNEEDFPDHRRNFFTFLRDLVAHCFNALTKGPSEQFDKVLKVIVWAMKHLDQKMAEIGLEALLCLLQKISISGNANKFYAHYLAFILKEVLKF